jgi:hypothetical protein
MLDLLEKYKSIIRTYRIISYEQEIDSYRIKVEITFVDGSMLFVKEYFFGNTERKYSFHWAESNGKVLCRWDNSPHWVQVSTFPHHKHVSGRVLDSRETTLEDVLLIISKELSPQH